MKKAPEVTNSTPSDFFLEQASAKLKLQHDWAKDLDTKASMLMGFSGVILTIAARTAPTCIPLRAGVILVLLAASAFGLMAYQLTTYEMPPDIKQLWQKYHGHEQTEVKAILTSNLVEAAEENRSRLENKVIWAKRAFWALFLGVALFAADHLIALLN